MNTSFYTWQIPQGNLSLILESQKYGLFLNNNIRLEEDNIEVVGNLDFADVADKTAAFLEGHFPIVTQNANVYSVIFYEMNLIDIQENQGINKTFEFNGLENKVLLPFSPTAPNYRRVIPGLNLEGKCATAGCSADGKIVYIPIGMSGPGYNNRFSIPRMIYEKAICPACQKVIPPGSVTNLGFYKCKYKIDGRLSDEASGDPRVLKTDTAEDQKFTTFKSGDHKTWVILDVNTEPTTQSSLRAARSSNSSGKTPTLTSRSGCALF